MRQALLGIVVSLGLLGSIYSLSVIRGELALNQARSIEAEKSVLGNDGRAFLEKLDALSQGSSSPSDIHKIAAAMYATAASRTRSIDEIVEYRCNELSQFGKYLNAHPRDGRTLIQWATLRQELGKVSCPGEFTSGDFRVAAVKAAELEAISPSVIYHAGVVLLRSGDRELAMEHFRKFIGYGINVTPEAEQVILSSFTTPREVLAVVPAKFPQIARWSVLLRSRAPALFEQAKNEISKIQLRAVSEAVVEYQQGRYPPDLHLKRLLSVLPIAASEGVRVRIDDELSQYFISRSEREISQYFAERSQMKEQVIVSGVRKLDSQPNRTPIVDWNPDGTLALDDRFTSIGFFTPEPRGVRFVEIRNALDSTGVIDASLIKVFVSRDNQKWQELDVRSVLSEIRIEGRQTILVRYTSPDAHYWKVHFGGADHARGFFNMTDDIIRVFG